MPKIDFYHYTSEEGKNAILRSGVIKASNPRVGDAVYGKGVYGTTLDPELFTKEQVAANNYDNSQANWMKIVYSGRVDFAFKIRIPSEEVDKISKSKRMILLHKGDIKLEDFDFEVIEVPDADDEDTEDDDEDD